MRTARSRKPTIPLLAQSVSLKLFVGIVILTVLLTMRDLRAEIAPARHAEAPTSAEEMLETALTRAEGGLFHEALQLLHKAAAAGSASALTAIGDLHERGLGVSRSEGEALSWYRKAANAGDPDGQARLGLALTRAPGADALKSGVALIRQAVARKSAYGEYALGTLHLQGRGVPRNETLGVDLLESAAGRGEIAAQSALGQMYLAGRVVPQHESTAVNFMTEAARRGESGAQKGLGDLFRDGRGVERDELESAFWYERAAERGDPEAMAQLALILLEGRQVFNDRLRANELLRQSAASGNALAQFALGVRLIEGRGMPQDQVQGMKLVRQSASLGHGEAQTYIRELPQ